LVQQLHAQQISVGQDFRLGGSSGTAADLQAIAASFGIPVTIVPLQNLAEFFAGDAVRASHQQFINPPSLRARRTATR